MKALLKKASDWNYNEIIEIENLDNLLKIDDRLIIEKDDYTLYANKRYNKSMVEDFEIVITIYDDYVE